MSKGTVLLWFSRAQGFFVWWGVVNSDTPKWTKCRESLCGELSNSSTCLLHLLPKAQGPLLKMEQKDSNICLLFLRQDLSLNVKLAVLARGTSQHAPDIYISGSSIVGLLKSIKMPVFYIGARDPNSGPHACSAEC